MDHWIRHLWLTRKNLPGNKLHQDRWCIVLFNTLLIVLVFSKLRRITLSHIVHSAL